jgi:Fe-S-cluster-containing dehydrogenase component
MLIDTEKCFGCAGCAIACKAENFTPPGIWWARVYHGETGKYPNAKRVAVPTVCMHCDNAPCVDVCPTGASYKRPDGIVAIDYNKCIGCKYCIQACPYGARQFLDKIKPYYPEYGLTPYEQFGYPKHQEQVVEKCTFCAHRVDAGNPTPACVQTCVGYARTFGDLDDPFSEVSQLIKEKGARPMKPELGTKPKVYYVALPQGW